MIFISHSGNELAFYENGRLWAQNPESFHAKVIASQLSCPYILQMQNYDPIKKCYNIDNVFIHTTADKRFSYAWHNGTKILSRFQILKATIPPYIKTGKEAEVVYP